LGLYKDDSKSEKWYIQRDIKPIAAKLAAIQVGTCYERASS
jgi:hypothetical protein